MTVKTSKAERTDNLEKIGLQVLKDYNISLNLQVGWSCDISFITPKPFSERKKAIALG